jgi:hypothetical protein
MPPGNDERWNRRNVERRHERVGAYANGSGLRYLNTIHRDLVTHGAEELYDAIIPSWDAFARDPSGERLDALRDNLERRKATSKGPVPSLAKKSSSPDEIRQTLRSGSNI